MGISDYWTRLEPSSSSVQVQILSSRAVLWNKLSSNELHFKVFIIEINLKKKEPKAPLQMAKHRWDVNFIDSREPPRPLSKNSEKMIFHTIHLDLCPIVSNAPTSSWFSSFILPRCIRVYFRACDRSSFWFIHHGEEFSWDRIKVSSFSPFVRQFVFWNLHTDRFYIKFVSRSRAMV